jgi:hypothetical protein
MATIDLEMASSLPAFDPDLTILGLGTGAWFAPLPVQGAKIGVEGDTVLLEDGPWLTGPGGLPGMATSHEENSDADGDGYPDPDIPVNGQQEENEMMPPGSVVGGPAPGPLDADGGGIILPPPIQEPTPDCRDTQAVEAKDSISERSDSDTREIGKLTYRTANGLQTSDFILGSGSKITFDRILTAIDALGISFGDIVAFTHNHDKEHYEVGESFAERSQNRLVNRYPSDNDWNFAREMVSRGAGGQDGAGFALYVIDTRGEMREFHYSNRSVYINMSLDDRKDGDNLPPETEAGSCGQ